MRALPSPPSADSSRVFLARRKTFDATVQHRYGVTVEKHLFSGDKHKRYFHLYFSPSKMAAERDRVEKKIAGMAATLKSLEGQKVELPKEYLNYFHCHFMKGKTKDEAKTFLYAEEKESVVQRELDLCGYFAIITSETMSAEQAYILYKGRDALDVILPFATPSTFHGVAKHAIFAGVQRQRRSAPAEQGAQHL